MATTSLWHRNTTVIVRTTNSADSTALDLVRNFGHRFRVLSVMLLLVALGCIEPHVKAQNTSASQACSAIAAGFLGCTLADNPVDCAWLEGLAQTCTADTNSLPPPPPPPPSPSTPCSQSILPEARPAAQSNSKALVAPRDQSSQIPCVVAVDPVPDLVSEGGSGVIQDPQTLATLGTVVTGIAADSAARIVLRVYANSPGDKLTVSVQAADNLGPPFGTLQTILPADGNSSGSQVTVTAVSTSAGPMGFVLYVPPQDFSRSGQAAASDNAAASRGITVTAAASATSSSCQTNITLWRPPVILVHGLWGDSWDWDNFTPFVSSTSGTPGDPRFNDPSSYSVHRAKYNYPISVSDLVPFVLPLGPPATSNSLGLEFNAPVVLLQIQEAIQDFRQLKQAAAVQADVVAHSMGGTLTRRLAYLSGYTDWTFGVGSVHKLITIGAPHLGTPLAGQLLQDSCVRNVFAVRGKYAIATAFAGGETVTGAVGDHQGDGTNDSSLSPELQFIQNPNSNKIPTLPIGAWMIAAVNPPSNTSELACPFPCNAAKLRIACSLLSSALAADFTPLGWPNVFGGQLSDVVIPLNSQLNGASSPLQVSGLIHAAALEELNFTGPGELDALSGPYTIQTIVINGLNASITNNSPFVLLPQ